MYAGASLHRAQAVEDQQPADATVRRLPARPAAVTLSRLRCHQGTTVIGNDGGRGVSNGVVAGICIAQVLGMAGFSAVPALLPELIAQWSLSHAEGGWLAGVLFAGYVGSVLVVVTLSDRIAARRLYLASAAVTVLANALLAGADGFGEALALRAAAGVGLAGTYMPGLKALSDRLEGARRARVVAWYTASFTVGAGLSFVVAGHAAALGGWRVALATAAALSACALPLALALLPRGAPAATAGGHPWQLLPVLRNRAAVAFVLAYAAVIWACAGVRQWLVVFLDASTLAGAGWGGDVYVVAALASMLGVPAALLGNELAIRIGFAPAAIRIFALGAVTSPLVGALLVAPAPLVVACVLLYAFVVQGNVSSLTAGVVAAAEPGRIGATMALHSFVGFSGGVVGPTVFGLVLDGAGGSAHSTAWMLAYGSCGLACAAGALAVAPAARRAAPTAAPRAGPRRR